MGRRTASELFGKRRGQASMNSACWLCREIGHRRRLLANQVTRIRPTCQALSNNPSSSGILHCRRSDDGSYRLRDQAMVLKLRKTTHDDRADTPCIFDEYRKFASGSRIVLLGKPITLQERAPLHLRLDGHVEGAVMEALD